MSSCITYFLLSLKNSYILYPYKESAIRVNTRNTDVVHIAVWLFPSELMLLKKASVADVMIKTTNTIDAPRY